jgi:hypothetical protein
VQVGDGRHGQHGGESASVAGASLLGSWSWQCNTLTQLNPTGCVALQSLSEFAKGRLPSLRRRPFVVGFFQCAV